jgi:hypothetical protein
MNERKRPSRVFHVLAAAAVVVLLASLLGVRLAARTGTTAEPAPEAARIEAGGVLVPPPVEFRVRDLEIPHWSHQNAREWPVRFRTDLDLLAPLGTGTRNAGEWFVDFRKPDGPRYGEARAIMDGRMEHPRGIGKVLPPDHPILREAEPWCDQAAMKFYPELLVPNGWTTQIPNLLVPLTLARSWMARGVDAEDPEEGLEDCRRAIRLGRLLRQEDAVIITDLVGLACIRIGAQGIYEIALKRGDTELALLASVVIGEVAPQRLLTSERVTRSWERGRLREDAPGALSLALPDERLDAMMEMARNEPDLRFRAEPVLAMAVVRILGTPAQRERVVEFLTELAASDEHPVLSDCARWALEAEPSREDLKEWM